MNRPRLFAGLGLALALAGMPAHAATGATGAKHLNRILLTHKLRVCIWPDYYGITYRDPKTQKLSGIDIDMAGALARELGAELVFVDSSFARLVDDLTRDNCDIAMFAIGLTPARAARLRFTSPHLGSDIYAVTSRTNRRIRDWNDIDHAGVVVAVAKGTLQETVLRTRLRAAELRVLDTPFAREQEVQAGRADVFMTDFPYSQRFLATSDWARVVAPPATYHFNAYAYAVKPGDDAWYERVESFVKAIRRDGRLLAAARRYRLETIVVP